MPTINGGRVTNDGSGQVGFKNEPASSNSSNSGNGNRESNTNSLIDVDLNLGGLFGGNGIKSIKGRNLGNGKGLFAGANGNYDVLLDFKTFVAGPGVTLTEDQNTIRIDFNSEQRRISFLNLFEAPDAIKPYGLLFGTSKGGLEFAPTPTVQNSVLTFNGVGFVWAAPTSSGTVTSVGLTGDSAIRVTGSPVTSAGVLNVSLNDTAVTPGTYTAATITVDQKGRITSATSTPVGEVNAAQSLGAGSAVYAGKAGQNLTFKSIKGFGAVKVLDSATEITLSADVGVTSVGLTTPAGSGISVSGATVTSTGTFDIALTNTGVTPGTYNSVTVDAKGRITAATFVNPPVVPTYTASNLGTGDGIFAARVGSDFRFKSLVAGGALKLTSGANTITLSADAVTGVTVLPGSGIQLSGDTTITTSGTFTVGLANAGVTPGTYSLARVTVDQYGRVTSVANGAVETVTASNVGTGSPIFAQKAGSDLQFRTLRGGDNVTIAQVGSEIVVSATVPPATAPTAPLSVSHGSTSLSEITNLNFADGFSLTAAGAGGARLAAGVAISDEAGTVVPFTSTIKLLGLTLSQEVGGAAVLSAPAPRANASVSQSGTLAVSNPTSLNFVNATVTQEGSQATITIPSSNLVVTSKVTNVDGTTTNVFNDIKTLKFSEKFLVATTLNAGELEIDTAVGAGSGQKLSFSQGAFEFTPNSVTVGSGLKIEGDAQTGILTLSLDIAEEANSVLLIGDQSVEGKKTFNDVLTANTDLIVGRNLTVVGQTILSNAVTAQAGLTVTGNATLNGTTLINGDTTANGKFTVKTDDSLFVDINVEGTGVNPTGSIRFEQGSGNWSFQNGGLPAKVVGAFVGSLDGNAKTATRLERAANVSVMGDIVVTPTQFDGASDLTLSAALSQTGVSAGEYTFPRLTVDDKGRVTAIESQNGTLTVTNIGGGDELVRQDGNNLYVNTLYAGNGILLRTTLTNTTISLDETKVGTVKQVAINGENGIVASGSPITTTGAYTLGLSNTTVTPGTYLNPTITIDQTGRITLAATGNAVASSDTAENLGTGDAHVFAQKDNGKFQFRSLVAGENITLTETGTTITVTAVIPEPDADTLSYVAVSDGTTTAEATTITFQGATVTQGTGNTAVVAIPAGTVTSVSARGDNAIQVSGSPITNFGTFDISLANTGVPAGTYNYATITVDAQGRITAASSNASPEGSGGGTVTSVAVASPSNDLVVSGGPITTSGTINLALGDTAVSAGSYGSASTVATFTVDSKGRLTAAGNSTIAVPSSAVTDAASANTPNVLVKRDASGNFSANTVTANLVGNASSATKLATAREIALTSDVVGSASFDGSQNVTISATLASTSVTPGQYSNPTVTVDQKGRVTSIQNGVSASITKRHSDVVTVTDATTKTYGFTYNAGTALILNQNFVIAYLNRTLLRPSEFVVNGNNTITLSINLGTGDELEVITTA